MKALITGAQGFVGQYLAQELCDYDVVTTDVAGADIALDLRDKSAVMDMMRAQRPDCIFHLAGLSSVARSWSNPRETLDVNVGGTLNLLDAMREICPEARVLVVGSSEQYGRIKNDLVTEEHPQQPESPYAISKKTQEEYALLYHRAYGLEVVATRSFNHTGPMQQLGFVAPDFARRVLDARRSGGSVRVGNLSARRDFSDVRDVVHAYRLLMERGRSGEAYNVGSGEAREVRSILDTMIDCAGVAIEVQIDPDLLRPVDVPTICADIGKLRADTGFMPRMAWEQTLRDTFAYWEESLKKEV